MRAAGFLCLFFLACGSDGGNGFEAGTEDGGNGIDGSGFVCNPPCMTGEKCSSQMRCIPADQCDTNADCPVAGTVCDPMTHKCVPGGGCGGSVIQGSLVAPNLLIVEDRSCSMTAKVNNVPKWTIAVQAINK